MLGALGALAVEALTGVAWQDAGKVRFLCMFLLDDGIFEYPFALFVLGLEGFGEPRLFLVGHLIEHLVALVFVKRVFVVLAVLISVFIISNIAIGSNLCVETRVLKLATRQ